MPTTERPSAPPWLFWAGIAVLVGLFIEGIVRFHFVCDDAYISFRYARHLVDGHGLVWNPGEVVEGYTNFSWVMLMAGGMVVGIPPEWLSVGLGTLAGVGVLVLLGRRTMAQFGSGSVLAWLPLAVLVTNHSFVAWTSGGLETMFFTLLIFAGVLCYLDEREAQSEWPLASTLLFALATLTRPEGGLFTAIVGCFFLQEVLSGKRDAKTLAVWVLPWFAVVGAHFGWRHAYYGAWLPNTFHAKMGEVGLAQGWRYAVAFYATHWAHGLTAICLIGLVRRDVKNLLFLSISLVYAAYLVRIGGDHIGFRFLVPLMPIWAWMVAEGVERITERYGRVKLALGLSAILVGLPVYVSHGRPSERTVKKVKSIRHLRWYADRRKGEALVLRGLVDDGLLPDDLRLAAGGIGALGYYTDLYLYDLRGLTQPEVAHNKAVGHWVGHERMASAEQLVAAGPALIDTINQVVYTEGFQHEFNDTEKKIVKRWTKDTGIIRPVCLTIPDGALIFSTVLEGEAFDEVFGSLQPCEGVD